ncbi:hypodermin-A-like [Brevipalpus obovatus]|uniref:hypodermin-A-like n=1 Tax=Brevipalpus obovatus TaxID=246614 RepID=UPI003D9F647F
MNFRKSILIVFCFRLSSSLYSHDDEHKNSSKSVNSTDENSVQHPKKDPPTGSKIRNGVKAKKDEFPYIVAISHSNNPNQIYGAGTIVGPEWILTADHVLRIGLKEGMHYVTPKYDNKVSEVEKGKKYQVLEYFCPKDTRADIGLMKLKETLPLNQEPYKFEKIHMIESNRKLDPHKNITVVGWGYLGYNTSRGDTLPEPTDASDLMTTDVQLRPDSECSSYSHFLDSKHFCVTGTSRGTCRGDSGGPVVIKNGSNPGDMLIGVVSGGSRYCNR